MDVDRLDRSNLPRFRALLRESRAADWSDAFLDRYVEWRYFGRGDCETSLVRLGGAYVAMIDSQFRTYRAGSGRQRIRETSEWFCLPRYRPIGVGVRLLQELMAGEEPMLSVRGTADNQRLLPRLGWRELPPVTGFFAMMNWRRALSGLPARLGAVLRRGRLRAVEAPGGVAAFNAAREAAPGGLAPLMPEWELDWLRSAPEPVGTYHLLQVFRDDEPRGLSLSRVYRGEHYRRALLVDLQPLAGDGAAADVVAGTVAELRRLGAVRITTRATDPAVCAGLVASGFGSEGTHPVYWWGTEPATSPGGAHLMLLRGDDHIRPFVPA